MQKVHPASVFYGGYLIVTWKKQRAGARQYMYHKNNIKLQHHIQAFKTKNQYKANITFFKGEENLVKIKFTIMETEALNASLETKFIHQVILRTASFWLFNNITFYTSFVLAKRPSLMISCFGWIRPGQRRIHSRIVSYTSVKTGRDAFCSVHDLFEIPFTRDRTNFWTNKNLHG